MAAWLSGDESPSGPSERWVLITRPEPGASETARRVAAMGFTPVVAPLLEIRSTLAHLPSSGQIRAILLPSGNAVERLPSIYRTVPVLTVGDATARRVAQAGFTNVASAGGDAIALATLVRARVNPRDGTLLLACGRGQGQDLAADLRASGYRVARRVVYAAEPITLLPDTARVALTDERVGTVLFFSAETARHFTRLVRAAGMIGQLSTREAITIGAQAGMALEATRWARIRVAAEPTQDAMLALLR
jgi:uroporphyrinogen-III synthase